MSKEIITKEDAQRMGELMYKQHNAVTSGRYDFTACQLDIIFMLLASLEEGKTTYRIHARDIQLITGREWNYQQLKESTKDIGSRMFEIETGTTYEQMWLFQKVTYLLGEGAFEVMISEPAKPLFFHLKNNFTHFQLKSVLSCTSKYAKRLYMLACQWRGVGSFPRSIPITELKKMLGLVDRKGIEQFVQIGQFKEKVLDVAKKQINEKTDISFDYELYKKGRSYRYVQIFVDRDKNLSRQLEVDYREPVEHQKNVRNVMAYGLCREHAELIARDGYEKFVEFVGEVNKKARKGEVKVENAPAYIIGAYRKKGVLPKK